MRYGHGPSWLTLLDDTCSKNPLVEYDLAYYKQEYGDDLLEIGSHLSGFFHKWAWGAGRAEFDEVLFSTSSEKSFFFKNFISKCIKERVISELSEVTDTCLKSEIELLQKIHPQSVITTNYDALCELIFPEYTPIVGQKIIKASGIPIGEIFKIHGCVNEYQEIIITSEDYEKWNSRKKYLSAKLLTFFLEHPILIIGYGAKDPNIISILRDIDEIISNQQSVIENIFYVIFDEKITEESNPPKDVLLDLGNGKSLRVNALYAKDFSWIYTAFGSSEVMNNVSPRTLRALMARAYNLVRYDIPKMEIQCSFSMLENVVNNNEELPKLLGITALTEHEKFNLVYPYTATEVAEVFLKEGLLRKVDKFLVSKLAKRISEEKGVNILESDNKYHVKVKTGKSEKSTSKKYSENAIDLFRKIISGEDYEVNI